MRRYGPARGRRINAKRLAITIAVVAAAVAAVIFCVYMFTEVKLDAATEQELYQGGTFEQGVSVGGVDVSGLTLAEGRVAVSPLVNQMLKANHIEFTVQGVEAPYTYTLEEMGVSVDAEPALKAAMLYGREGTRFDLLFGEKEKADFPIERKFDEAAVSSTINSLAAASEWDQEAINARYKVETTKSEEDLTTGGQLVKTEPKDGFRVKTDEMIASITNQIQTEQYAVFEAPVEVIQSQDVSEVGGEPALMGSKTTEFGDSDSNRKYNIWKMSSILNGTIFYPGDVFSVNDTAGDRNAENGWKEANGIENGQYTPQYGGGICQVSSTMYNAALQAEMKMVNRVPHTIAAKYVPKGMDATISTGGPDFKVENILDDPMYMIIKCDAKEGTITVEIWGYDTRNYKVKLYSEQDVTQQVPLPIPEYKTNAELGTYEIKKVRNGQQGEVWNVYMDKLDKQTDEVIESKIFVTKSTYKAIAPLYELGSGIAVPAAGTPIETVQANAAALSGAAAAPPVEVAPDPVTPTEPSTEATTPAAGQGATTAA